jgi:hypothetical protein
LGTIYYEEVCHMNLIMENWKKFINEEKIDERCQKGYKTHPKRKTKKMYGKTYRNCIKAEGLEEEKDPDSKEDEEDEEELKKIKKELEGASKMHKSQADRIGDVMKEEELNEIELEEKKKRKKRKKKKKKAKRDACYHKVRARYDVWPSAYASGALVKCRKVGAKNWGNKSKKNENKEFEDFLLQTIEEEIVNLLEKKKRRKKSKKRKKAGSESSKESSLRDWFGRKGAKGKKKGWVDCNAPDGKGGYKSCGRSSGEKRKKYPACRPTPSACKERGKGKSWGKKAKSKSKKRESLDMQLDKDLLISMIKEEYSKTLEEYREGVDINYYHITDATYDDGTAAEDIEFWDDVIEEAEYRGRKVTLNKPMRGDVKKSKVYVKNAKGNVVKVNFGDKKMKIKKSNPKRRKSFRARHNCKNPGPKWKARYWSCKAW